MFAHLQQIKFNIINTTVKHILLFSDKAHFEATKPITTTSQNLPHGHGAQLVHPAPHEDQSLTNSALSASQSSLRSAPDYDSSATLSADEGPDPKHESTHRSAHASSHVPHAGQKRSYDAAGMAHPEALAKNQFTPCVRDIINTTIEKNLGGYMPEDLTSESSFIVSFVPITNSNVISFYY